ncbi:hypothetical protein J5N97_023789 [Dioscorea zingiberensis]|uniref:Diacylglycerol O-acyltransferase n=1 Tax=Dioscorea zingiberensis TaxID=325984 RepID=A0A9D5H8B1_9LILI|nr:hypothetical protein J5N97_023789 [Dioscorea zingiberensis]
MEEDDEPVSPTGQYFSSSVLNVTVLVVFDSAVPVDDSHAVWALENIFLPLNPRFSSIMVGEEDGVQKWRKVEVKVEEHVKVPVFPQGLEKYDECLQEYITKLSVEPLPFSRPLWDINIIKYPTSTAAGNLLFRLHHALGDGFSLMAALFAYLKRADDPSLPLTFPSSDDDKKAEKRQRKRWSLFHDFLRFSSACVNTVGDFGWSLMKSTVLEDSVSSIRTGVAPFVESKPITLSYITFSLDDIKRIKEKVNVSVNDVLVGMIFHGLHLYMQEADPWSNNKSSPQVTALVLLNTRAITSYKSMEEMIKPNSKARWGNQFAFLHIPIPSFDNNEKKKNNNPFHFVLQAKKYIRAKRFSFGMHLTGALLEIIRMLKGPQAASSYTRKTLINSSLAISNIIGPMEQVQLHGHPISGFHFMMFGNPQSLTISILSYMGNVRVAFGAEKGFIDSQLLVSCMEKSFEMLYEATVVNKEDQAYRHELHAKQT